jgi:hypothetical protein
VEIEASHAIAALRAGVLGQDMDIHFQLRRDEFKLPRQVLADALFLAAAAGANFLLLGHVMLDAMVGEMIEGHPPLRARGFGRGHERGGIALGESDRFGLDQNVVEIEQMALARVVDVAFATRSEDIAAKQGQCLSQFGVLLLQLAVVGRGLVKHALEFVDPPLRLFGLSLRLFGLPLSVLGLPPQLVVAAEQVVEQSLELLRVVGETWYDAHNMNYSRIFMLCKSYVADFPDFLTR